MRRDALLGLFMGTSSLPDTEEAPTVGTPEYGYGRAWKVSVNNSSVFYLKKLTSILYMDSLTIQGTLRNDDARDGSHDDGDEVS